MIILLNFLLLVMTLFQVVYTRTFRYVAGTGAVLMFGFQTLPHLFPQKTMSIVHGTPPNNNMNPKFKKLLDETCKLMDIDSNCVTLTHSSGFSTVSAGDLLLPNKSVIALPRNARYATKEELTCANIVFSKKPIDWSSSSGIALQDVLVLTDNDIRFLIGHELTHIKNRDFLPAAIHGVTVISLFYMLGASLPKLLKQNKFGRIVAINWSVWLSGIPFFYFTKRYMSHQIEFNADVTSARLSEDYCEGGIHYTRNRMKLNRILRSMHGVMGDKLFSRVGNDLSDTLSHPPRSERLRKLKTISKENVQHEVEIER